jgi:hypothetical protein
MAHAYTPGLRITAYTRLRKRRALPIPGSVLVETNTKVSSHTVIARTELPGHVYPVNIAHALSISPEDIRRYLLKTGGDAIEKGLPLAENKPFIKWFKTQVLSPITGVLENISEITGQVMLREPARPLELLAYMDGWVLEVIPRQGAIIETTGCFIQGIFGVGGETTGVIRLAAENPEDILLAEKITEQHRGAVLIGGSLVENQALKRAKEIGVNGVVVGGINDQDLRELLGYDLGVAITGTEDIGFTLIITEGFGQIPMARNTFELLVAKEGFKSSISGATQIRAGVLRPEIIIPLEDKTESEIMMPLSKEVAQRGLEVGDMIRIIREPYFGILARVVSLPSEAQRIATESNARILLAELPDGTQTIIPRANVEIIEKR